MSIQSVGAEVLKASLNSLHRANEFASPIASEVIKKLSVISTQSINNGIPSDLVGPGCFIGCVAMTIAYGKHKAMRSEKSGKTRTANERSESPATTNCSPISASNVGSEYSPIEKERSFSQDSLEGERNTNDAKKKLTMLSHKNKKKHDDATLSDTTSRSLVSTTATPATTHATASTGTLFSGDSTQRDLYNNYGHTPYARSSSPAHSSSRLPAPSPSARSSDNMNVTLIDGEGAPIPHGAAMAVRYPKSQYVAQRPMIVRFPLNGNSKEDAFYYFRNRTTEALVEGLVLQELRELSGGWGVEATFRFDMPSSATYHSLYVYERHRRKGHYKSWLAKNSGKTVLVLNPSGDMQSFLKHCDRALGLPVRYKVLQHTVRDRWIEYRLVQDFYGDHVAKRTSAHLMNHIDEGLWVLRYMRASELAMRAYILHPMVQGDSDFADFMERLRDPADKARLVDKRVLALAAEYRSVANEYLSSNRRRRIRLSPLREVNDMLIADKVQNRKDFELFHSSTHDKRDRLAAYFAEWLAALEVSEDIYAHCRREIIECVAGKGRVGAADAFEY